MNAIGKSKTEMNRMEQEARDSYRDALMIQQNSAMWQAERIVQKDKKDKARMTSM